MCPAWLLLVVAVVGGVARGAATHCWEQPSCQDLSSESSMLECVQLCRSDLTAETPMYPGEAHLQPIADPDASPPLAIYPSSPSSEPRGGPGAKRSYSMEHFRWGKPVGRKRRPIKVFTSNGVEEESSEVFPGETRRELAPGGEEQEEEEGLRGGGNDIRVNGEAARRRLPEVGVGLLLLQRHQEEQEEERKEEKKDGGGGGGGAGSYRMSHFRWSGPPASKRYGGFMKSWDERTQKPLLTLFKNVINKDGQQAKRVD